MSDYKQGQRVYFNMGDGKPSGWALINGVQGFVVILSPEKPLPNYEYTHFYAIDSQLSDGPTEKPVVAEEVDDGL